MKHTEIEKFFKGNIEIPSYDHLTANKAKHRQDELTKPIGSLGKLEEKSPETDVIELDTSY